MLSLSSPGKYQRLSFLYLENNKKKVVPDAFLGASLEMLLQQWSAQKAG